MVQASYSENRQALFWKMKRLFAENNTPILGNDTPIQGKEYAYSRKIIRLFEESSTPVRGK
jgi:myo-inositol-1-phosphate synthase